MMTQPPSRQRPVFHDSGDPIEDAKTILTPQVAAAIGGMAQLKFTTGEFIQGYRRARGGEPAYQHALAWLSVKHGNHRLAEQTLYGIIFPNLLRASGMVAWAGFAREQTEEDSLGVPAWWQKTVLSRPGKAGGG
jgi:hypothetical protein